MSLWIESLEATHDVETVATYVGYSKRYLTFFGTDLSRITRARMGDYQRARLTQVLRSTVRKERSALNVFFAWCVEQAVLAEEHVPQWPTLPKRATGVRSGKQRSAPVDVSAEQVRAFVLALPLVSLRTRKGRPFPVRARFVFMAETGLRPATLDGLRSPEHWTPGARSVEIPDELDKGRFGRSLPLTDRAIAALEAAVALGTGPGLIFGRHDYRSTWERARVASGLPKGFAPYDLRHHFIGLVADHAEARAAMFLSGHRRLTTTNRYVRPAQDRAREALTARGSGGILGEGDNMLSAKEGNRTPTRVTPLEPESTRIPQTSDTYESARAPEVPESTPEGPGSGGHPKTPIGAAAHYLALLRATEDGYDALLAATEDES